MKLGYLDPQWISGRGTDVSAIEFIYVPTLGMYSRPDGGIAMSYLLAAPELLTSAASDVAGIGSTLNAATAAAAAPTNQLPAAAKDEGSVAGGGPVRRARGERPGRR